MSAATPALRILLVGSGRMGSAMLRGWLGQSVTDPGAITVVEPDEQRRTQVAAAHGVPVHAAVPDAWSGDAVVFAVKPQILDQVLPAYRAHCAAGCAVSIAAGKDLSALARGVGRAVPIVRAMPNLPASVGRGVSVAVPNPQVDAAIRDRADRLLGAVGSVHWIEDEALMDAVTALSGSGPAYLFLLTEAMAEAGGQAGLPAALAHSLARETVAGAAALMAATDDDPAQLRADVTSPGGTTAAALDVLMENDRWAATVARAVAAAADRSRELAAVQEG